MEQLLARLKEVGKVLSTANETKVRAAIVALQNVIDSMGSGTQEAERAVAQAEEVLSELSVLSEATWDAAFINNLPDSAFLYIAPGGTKDKTGQTVPRSNRYFPVYDDAGAVDLPHLRNALARIPQSSLDQTVKDSVTVKAKALAKKNIPGYKESAALAEGHPVSMSYDDVRQELSAALKMKLGIGQGIDGPWVRDVYDDYLIYELGDKTFQMNYSIDDKGVVTTEQPAEVEVVKSYVPVVGEAQGDAIQGDFIPLEEKAVGKDGTTEIKIISPGWGSSGYYSKEMLARDAPVYTRGTHMYWDHPTESEERERPERSLRDLAAQLTTGGAYQENGPRGPGVYAQAKVFGPYKEVLEELAPHIGVSHRAFGKAVSGEAEGKKGPIVEKLVAAKSVDFVTTPGAGGEVVQVFEAARGKATIATDTSNPEGSQTREGYRMSDEELKELKEAKAKVAELEEAKTKLEEEAARFAEAQVLREAHDLAEEKVGESKLPEITQKRLVETLAAKPVIKEGALDKEEYGKIIEEAVKAEIAYVAELTKSGSIKGMGSSGDSDNGKERLKESFKQNYLREGKSPDDAEKMAEIAVRGR